MKFACPVCFQDSDLNVEIDLGGNLLSQFNRNLIKLICPNCKYTAPQHRTEWKMTKDGYQPVAIDTFWIPAYLPHWAEQLERVPLWEPENPPNLKDMIIPN